METNASSTFTASVVKLRWKEAEESIKHAEEIIKFVEELWRTLSQRERERRRVIESAKAYVNSLKGVYTAFLIRFLC